MKNIGKYEIISKIGKGAQGTVYLGRDDQDKKVAIKEVKIRSKESLELFNIETKNLKLLSYLPCYPNISCYIDSFNDPNYDSNNLVYLILEYYDGKDIEDFVNEITNYTDVNTRYIIILNILIILLKVLSYIHEKGIIHGDIKTENILIVMKSVSQEFNDTISTDLSLNFKPILIDFGLSCNIKDKNCMKISGTPLYMAPETARAVVNSQKSSSLIVDQGMNNLTDIWALGLTFYVSMYNKDIWPNVGTIKELAQTIASGKRKFIIDTPNKKLNILIENMLKYDPKERLSANELLELYYKL